MISFDDLSGKAVLVTGSGTGIGAAVAAGFAECGARVALHYRQSGKAANAVAEAIRARGGEAVVLSADLSKRGAGARLVGEAIAKLGGLDVLINNAGDLVGRRKIDEIDDAFFDQVLDLNVRSAISASGAAVAHFRAQGRGCLINTGSVAARNGGGPGAALYAASKAFLQSVTRTLARELAPYAIRVNAVAPGVIYTPFQERHTSPELLASFKGMIPLGRLGSPEDCVGAYLFLASERMSGFITGQVMEVNGGQLMP